MTNLVVTSCCIRVIGIPLQAPSEFPNAGAGWHVIFGISEDKPKGPSVWHTHSTYLQNKAWLGVLSSRSFQDWHNINGWKVLDLVWRGCCQTGMGGFEGKSQYHYYRWKISNRSWWTVQKAGVSKEPGIKTLETMEGEEQKADTASWEATSTMYVRRARTYWLCYSFYKKIWALEFRQVKSRSFHWGSIGLICLPHVDTAGLVGYPTVQFMQFTLTMIKTLSICFIRQKCSFFDCVWQSMDNHHWDSCAIRSFKYTSEGWPLLPK